MSDLPSELPQHADTHAFEPAVEGTDTPAPASEPAPATTQPPRRRRNRRPPRSPAQVRASQQNGSRSRGPVSEQGRSQSKLNALKHGLCAATILLPGEKPERFAQRLAAWNADFDPQSDIEGYLVADIVGASWKLDRCQRVDALALTELMHSATRRYDDLLNSQHQQYRIELSQGQPQAVAKMGRTVTGCRWLAERWPALAHILQRQGRWTLEQTREALTLLGCDPGREAGSYPEARQTLAAALALLYTTRPTTEALSKALVAARIGDPTTEVARLLAELPLPGAARRTLEELAAQQHASWTARRAVIEPLEAEARTVAVSTAALDLSWKGEHRLRYEQAHRRAFHGALRELRTEQARRRSVEESSWSREDVPAIANEMIRQMALNNAAGAATNDQSKSADQPHWSSLMQSGGEGVSFGVQEESTPQEFMQVMAGLLQAQQAQVAAPAPAPAPSAGAERTQGSPQDVVAPAPVRTLTRKQRKKLEAAEKARQRREAGLQPAPAPSGVTTLPISILPQPGGASNPK